MYHRSATGTIEEQHADMLLLMLCSWCLQADNMPGQLPGRQIDDYLSTLSGSNAPADDDGNGLSDANTSMQSISLI